jgi:hypothetical protein
MPTIKVTDENFDKNVGVKVGATSKEDIKNWLMSKI